MSAPSLTTNFLTDARAPSPVGGWTRQARAPRTEPPRRVRLWAVLRTAYQRHRSRVALAQLDGHLLHDIGVSFAEAENEANKRFWQP